MKKVVKILIILLTISIIIPQTVSATTLQEYEDQLEKYQNELNDKNSQIAVSKKELEEVMAAITDENGPDYIPVENRVAVFDLDGTLFCETDPNYFDCMLLEYRVLEDPDLLLYVWSKIYLQVYNTL